MTDRPTHVRRDVGGCSPCLPVPEDPRVALSREFLDAIRLYPVASRPISVLQREDAELRRMLGKVLDYIAETGQART